MKKITIILLLIYTMSDLFSIDIFSDNFIVGRPGMGEILFYDGIVYVWVEDIASPKQVTIDKLSINEFGYYILPLQEYDLFLIPGDNNFQYFISTSFTGESYVNWRNKQFPSINNEYRSHINIREIKASSFFAETIAGKKIEYRPEYLLDRYSGRRHFFVPFSLPWVEGVEGNGIGEYLEIQFETEINNFSMINGYIDIGKQYLFHANNRVKKAKITSDDSDFILIIDFDDIVEYTKVQLPVFVKSIKFEILEVYNGTKYTDTVISSIIGISHNISYNEQDFDYFIERAKLNTN